MVERQWGARTCAVVPGSVGANSWLVVLGEAAAGKTEFGIALGVRRVCRGACAQVALVVKRLRSLTEKKSVETKGATWRQKAQEKR